MTHQQTNLMILRESNQFNEKKLLTKTTTKKGFEKTTTTTTKEPIQGKETLNKRNSNENNKKKG